jgi:hypothetical protein
VGMALAGYAQVLSHTGRKREARKMAERAAAIQDKPQRSSNRTIDVADPRAAAAFRPLRAAFRTQPAIRRIRSSGPAPRANPSRPMAGEGE